jgi:hypothetical protein
MYKLFGKSKPSNETNTKTKSKLECPICMDKKIDTCMVSCGHTFCGKCVEKALKCFICDAEIFMKQKIYI